MGFFLLLVLMVVIGSWVVPVLANLVVTISRAAMWLVVNWFVAMVIWNALKTVAN